VSCEAVTDAIYVKLGNRLKVPRVNAPETRKHTLFPTPTPTPKTEMMRSLILFTTLSSISSFLFHSSRSFFPKPHSISHPNSHPPSHLHLFDELTKNLSLATSSFTSSLPKKEKITRLTSSNIKPSLQKIRRALLNADVNRAVTDKLLNAIEMKSIGEKIVPGVDPGQMFTKIVQDEMKKMLGEKVEGILFREDSKDNPVVVLLAGLQGAGKTTACGKLALYLQSVELKPVLKDDSKIAGLSAEEAEKQVSGG